MTLRHLVPLLLWVAAPVPAGRAVADTRGSAAIYPPAGRVEIRFSHSRHRKQSCESCHRSVRTSVGVRDRNVPREASCSPCHSTHTRRKETERSGPPARCGLCHRDYDGHGPPARTVLPIANLRFGHRLHLERGVSCGACHEMSGAGTRPSMTTCVECHRERKADSRCVACHLTQKDGRLRTRFPSGDLRPLGGIAGDAHTRDFARRHAAAARANRDYCERCHAPRSCLRCHAGSLRPMTIHSGDYASRHAVDARRNEPRCERCHRSQTFCLGCHQRTGVGQETPGGGFRPSTGRRFHPPGFVAVSPGPAHHGNAARRNIRTCTSCHREQTCVRCHGTRSRGRAGFSPHPPGFRGSLKCRALSARNQRVCLKCHTPGDRRIDCSP